VVLVDVFVVTVDLDLELVLELYLELLALPFGLLPPGNLLELDLDLDLDLIPLDVGLLLPPIGKPPPVFIVLVVTVLLLDEAPNGPAVFGSPPPVLIVLVSFLAAAGVNGPPIVGSLSDPS